MREVVGGLALIVGGAAYLLHTAYSLPLGTMRAMGPGMFPLGLGSLLCLIGAGVLAMALVEEKVPLPRIDLRVLLAVLASVGAFALLIRSYGLFPAIAATTAISSLAAPGMKLVSILLLMAGLMLMAWLIFIQILDLPVAVFGAI